jgi:RNA polymerase sigma factor (sigma-70 family)
MSGLLAMWGLGRAAPADSEAALLAAARRGDRPALDALYRRHASQAFTAALRVVGDHALAEDVVQDAFLRAFARLDGYRGAAPFAAWLGRIVVNLAVERVRADWRWAGETGELEVQSAAAVDPGAQRDALGLLARLAAPARTVVVLYELEGYSHAEIAALLGRSEDWSKTTLSRARRRLGELLGGPP